LSEYDADVLTSQKPMADYFEKMIVNNADYAKLCANWIIGEMSASLNKHQIE
jgi:aspartyl-tRNA(Asn)/glutamyl-tRNA(Gln) amidotransferase subunit B